MTKHILSCSFGKDSIATALLALQHGEPLDELVLRSWTERKAYWKICGAV